MRFWCVAFPVPVAVSLFPIQRILRAFENSHVSRSTWQNSNLKIRDFKGLPAQAPLVKVTSFDSAVPACSPAVRAKGVGIICQKARDAGYTAAGSMTTGASLFGVANSRGVFAEAESTDC